MLGHANEAAQEPSWQLLMIVMIYRWVQIGRGKSDVLKKYVFFWEVLMK